MLALKRPLTLPTGYNDIALEKICPICGGSGKRFPDIEESKLPCDSCTGGYLPTHEGKVILQFVLFHFRTIMPNIEVLNEFVERFSVRPR